MKSLSSVGLGLSIVFGSLLLALVAELYYLLWWKKRLTSKRDLENFFYMFFCLKTSSSSSSPVALNPQEIRPTTNEQQFIMELKPFDDHHHELMGGPPRFLFTIVEETKEDLECCDQESNKSNSKGKFGSMLINVETPYMTPLASSPPFLTPPHTPSPPMALLESTSDAEFNKMIRSSPSPPPPQPPKFKFLKEAEEKLNKRVLMEERVDNDNINVGFDYDIEENGDVTTPPSKYLKDDDDEDEDEDESFITINVDRSKEILGYSEINNQQQFHSSNYASQVLPLSSSPTPISNKKL